MATLMGTSVKMIEDHYSHVQLELLNQYVNDFANKINGDKVLLETNV